MKTILLVVALILALTLFAAVAAGTHRVQMRSETSTMNGMMNEGMMLPFTAEYEDVPGGIRLTLRPKDPARLEEFRAQVRQHEERMKNGECLMMSGMMNRMMQDMVPKAEPQPDHSAHHE
jgi:hypothetical protein